MKSILAFVGFKGSGKNTAAEALKDHGYVSMSFADALKDALAAIFCWDRQLLEGITSESRIWREEVDQWWADKLGIPEFTPRYAMTNFGTNVMRKHFSENIWILNVERRIMNIPDYKSVVLTDARFPNEIALARRYNGKIYRIQNSLDPWWINHAIAANAGDDSQRLIMEDLKIHESEWAWLGCPVDGTILNFSTIPDLHEKVRQTILKDAS